MFLVSTFAIRNLEAHPNECVKERHTAVDSENWTNRASKLFNIRLYATLYFNYFRWHRRMFSYGSMFELLIS